MLIFHYVHLLSWGIKYKEGRVVSSPNVLVRLDNIYHNNAFPIVGLGAVIYVAILEVSSNISPATIFTAAKTIVRRFGSMFIGVVTASTSMLIA
jgi:hypothetical protein